MFLACWRIRENAHKMHIIKIFVLVSFLQRDTQEEKESSQGLGV